jgi:hypothetical protein
MLRGNFEMPGNMVVTDHLHIPGIVGKSQIIPDAGTDEDMFDTGDPANPGKQPALFSMTCPEVFTGRAAAFICTGTDGFPLVAGKAVHVRGRTPDILDDSFESWHLGHPCHFTDDRVAAPALDDTSLVVREGTKGAGAKTSPVACYRELHRYECGDRLRIRGMSPAAVRKLIDMVQLRLRERKGGAILDHDRLWVRLGYRSSSHRVLFSIMQRERMGVCGFILRNLGKPGDFNDLLRAAPAPLGNLHSEHGTGNIPESVNTFTGCQPLRDLHHLSFAHAENEKICRGVSKERLSHPILPVIVVSEPAQACLDPPDDNRDAGKEFMHPICIHDRCTIRPL